VPREKPLYGYIKPIIQQVLVLCCGFAGRDEDGRINLGSVLKDSHGMSGQAWSCVPLEEPNLTPSLLISGLVQYLGYLRGQRAGHNVGMIDPVAINLANQLSMPSFLEGTENSAQIYPICEYFYKTPRDSWSLGPPGGWWKHCLIITPGEWTLVILGGGDSAFRSLNCQYAFVTTDEPVEQQQQSSEFNSRLPNLVIETFEGFLDRQSLSVTERESVLRIWARATDPAIDKGVVSLLGKPELESMLRSLMYPKITTDEVSPASSLSDLDDSD
jgi:hypothetical protein